MKHVIARLAALFVVILLSACAEPLPVKVGACYDNACVNVSTVIPARKVRASAKDVTDVQPISEAEHEELLKWMRENFYDADLTRALNAPRPARHD